ncbi:hypothetical protein IWQ61_004830 [Dispira simplex]|nr:hypothetical protein IWQ61_004830 [Dispira simplex]
MSFKILVKSALLFLALTSPTSAEGNPGDIRYNNGTCGFKDTVIMLSFDGFRYDYMERGLTPHLANIVEMGGVQAAYMTPSFPSVTFSNHYSLVTGLHPESHGIVNNQFYDPSFDEVFIHYDKKVSTDPKWWGGEPLWVTAHKQGLRSASAMWLGSQAEIQGKNPDYLIPYKPVEPYKKVDQLLAWLDLPVEERPSLLLGYFPEVDEAGHYNGANGKEVDDTLVKIDRAIDYLQNQLALRNLTDIVNVVYVSDHGMHSVPREHYIMFDKVYPDMGDFKLVSSDPMVALYPHDYRKVPEIYKKLKEASEGQHWKAYLKDHLPKEFHYRNSDRIAPIVCIPESDYTFSTTKQYENSKIWWKRGDASGIHGYNNTDPMMRAIFVAHGPNFRNTTSVLGAPMKYQDDNIKTPRDLHRPIQLVDVYNIVAKVLNLEPAHNNGTKF